MGLDGVGLAQGQSRDEAMVRSLDDQERIAALKKDTKALERLWSDQFVGNQPGGHPKPAINRHLKTGN
jgi:hypothetical protein